MLSIFRTKPVWVGGLGLLALALVIKLALAITAFTPGDQPVGYVSQDEMTNYNLKSGNETLFRGQYEREQWSGGLLAYPIDSAGNVGTAARWWDAGEQIDLQNFDTGRFIATMKDDGTAVPFRLASLSSVQQTSLNNNAALVSFLRGDQSAEGSTFRDRRHVLGDVVHSRPFYVADDTYPTVFVGSNDGMLHAVNAVHTTGGGQERWAYVPSMLLPKMKNLAVAPYVHDYYVDGQINIASISSDTKRVLVGGLGAGGKGLYALDITDSAGLNATSDADVAAKVMWEISPTKLSYANPSTTNAYINLGYTYGTVTLAKVAGVDAVIVGNGYNDGVGTYTNCTNGTPTYSNCGGNYAAYLYVINAATGQLISAIKAGANGTAASPNGLSTASAVDSDGDGSVDTVFAGDLNGTMWRFNLTTNTATALMTTSPAQPITATPGVAAHPNGGYMVTFGTGRMLVTADATDSSVYYAYGVWDSAPAGNTTFVAQTLTERSYTVSGVTTRVRRVTSTQPNWASGGDKGWSVALPAGERVVGEGSFTENGRFYFTGYNPTISTTIPSTTTVVKGENWLMELDYLSGGAKNQPFLDLSGDVILNNDDRIKYIAGDVIPVTNPATSVGDPILTTDGISIGKFISIGVLSQPILVQLVSLNDTLFNQNPDIVIPPVILGQGVDGGHFDQDIYYGSGTAAQATARITVGTTGQTSPFPATLGAITVNGVTVVPALTVNDLPNGTNTTVNAETIRSKVTNGFTATRSGSRVTITAPVGSSYNGMVLSIAAGTSQNLVSAVPGITAVAAVAPTSGVLVMSAVTQNQSASIKCGSTFVGSSSAFTSSNSSVASTRLDALFTSINNSVNGYTTSCIKGGIPTNRLTCTIAAPVGVSACSGGFTVDNDITVTSNLGPQGGVNAVVGVAGVAQSGWTDYKPALGTPTVFSGGADATAGDPCTSTCGAENHVHQYDDKYDVTGVNFLNPSIISQRLSNAIPSTSTQFKVLAQNQYLSPAVKLHIGNPAYLFDVDAGYVSIRNFLTSATLDLGTLPTYVTATTATAPILPIGSFAINMPVDALTPKNWWGNGDVRVGLHPTVYNCVYSAAGATDGNMYQPVVPPANGIDGPGVAGWSSTTTPDTATGARHNGALTFQLIAANTPNSAIEQNVPGRPEYGWRVKSAVFKNYVLAEYNTYWHHPNGKCYGNTGWTKTPGPDNGSSANATKAAGSTDPKIGDLSGNGGSIVSTTTTVVGNITTTIIVYSNTLRASIVRTAHDDGSVTIVTTDTSGNVTTQIVANSAGSVKTGGDERGLLARLGRISWRELVTP